MKDISNEQLFVDVVDKGSFKQAAEALGLEPSLVSRRVASLEARLQVKLLERSTRRTTPTEAGQRYVAGLKAIIEEQQALERQVCGQVNQPSGHLKVAAPHDFGCVFVSPVLETMVDDFEHLSVELMLGSHYENLQSQGIDVAVRIGQLPDSSLICRRLGDVPRVLVASPEYLEKRGRPASVAQLAEHNFVFYRRLPPASVLQIGGQPVRVTGNVVVNSVSAVRQWVEKGRGIHLGPAWAFDEALARGSLVRILPDVPLDSYPLHALYLSRMYLPAKVQVFVERLAALYRQKSAR